MYLRYFWIVLYEEDCSITNKMRIYSSNVCFINWFKVTARRFTAIQRIIAISLAFFISIIVFDMEIVYAEELMRSSSLDIKKTEDGDTERIDYVNEYGKITYAADKHYATVIKTKTGNTLLEKYLDAEGKPAVQSLGHYALLHEYNDEGKDYKISYLGVDGNLVINNLGYSTTIRTYNADGYVKSEMYYGTDGKPIETYKLAYGCVKEYNEKGRNILITYLDQNHNPTISGQGFSILSRSFYEEDGLAGKVKEEFYYNTDGTPISLSLGQFGILKQYDEFGRVTVVTYLDADGLPIITNEGYTIVKKTYKEDDSIKIEQYYDIYGNPISLSEGQYGYRVEDGNKIYIDSYGNDLFNLKSYLYSNHNSVLIICMIVVFVSIILGRKLNMLILLLYFIFIFYMTFLYRKVGTHYLNLKPFWSYVQFFYNKELRWEILNNVFLFIPLGTILSQIIPKKRVLVFIIVLSILIELLQLITGTGLCEIDDLISNTIGGVLGFIIGITFLTLTGSI